MYKTFLVLGMALFYFAVFRMAIPTLVSSQSDLGLLGAVALVFSTIFMTFRAIYLWRKI